jgi:hypothetical protein
MGWLKHTTSPHAHWHTWLVHTCAVTYAHAHRYMNRYMNASHPPTWKMLILNIAHLKKRFRHKLSSNVQSWRRDLPQPVPAPCKKKNSTLAQSQLYTRNTSYCLPQSSSCPLTMHTYRGVHTIQPRTSIPWKWLQFIVQTIVERVQTSGGQKPFQFTPYHHCNPPYNGHSFVSRAHT